MVTLITCQKRDQPELCLCVDPQRSSNSQYTSILKLLRSGSLSNIVKYKTSLIYLLLKALQIKTKLFSDTLQSLYHSGKESWIQNSLIPSASTAKHFFFFFFARNHSIVDCKYKEFRGKEKAYVNKYLIQILLHTEITGVQFISNKLETALAQCD